MNKSSGLQKKKRISKNLLIGIKELSKLSGFTIKFEFLSVFIILNIWYSWESMEFSCSQGNFFTEALDEDLQTHFLFDISLDEGLKIDTESSTQKLYKLKTPSGASITKKKSYVHTAGRSLML